MHAVVLMSRASSDAVLLCGLHYVCGVAAAALFPAASVNMDDPNCINYKVSLICDHTTVVNILLCLRVPPAALCVCSNHCVLIV